ncbi:hypothetical protein IFT48_03215 [Pseudomonas fluorescens]|uniref:hypothetical protein n=1 Tax=Pseudomonas fluorescens TaxID=294 RepID=UPI001930CD80|nr:hypothetical protein [Pseudomonas fluorescens]MBD8088978.1 hypothetical protein [Pseudomonas fluorescens]
MSFENPLPFFRGLPATGAVKALEVSQAMDLEQEYQDSLLQYRRGERDSGQQSLRNVSGRYAAYLANGPSWDKVKGSNLQAPQAN